MFNSAPSSQHHNSSFNRSEEININQKVTAELNDAQSKMVKLSLIINPVVGSFVIMVLHKQIDLTLMLKWYAVLVITCVLNFLWSFYHDYNKFNASRLKIWRAGYHFILAVLCLTWGSIGILFVNDNIHSQLFVITFLQIALVAFNFGAMTDFISTVNNTVSMLIPFLVFHIYLGIHSIKTTGTDSALNFASSASLAILGTFLLLTTFIGSRLIRRFFTLIFENVALSKKLENMNKILEQRVQERTQELEESLKLVTYQATHDLLTDLPNQRLLIENISLAIASAKKNNSMFSIIFLNINEMDKINDGLGHQAGDFVTKTVAQRLKTILDTQKQNNLQHLLTLSRKDVFIILLEPIFNTIDVEEKAKSLFSMLDEPIYIENQIIKLTASIGISIYPHNGEDLKSLLMNADAAMMRAKKFGGNNLNMYKSEINAHLMRQLEIESSLHTALAKKEFFLHYQPYIDLNTKQICGMEALLRWENPVLGLVPCDKFIPLAEENGIIIPLGAWVLRTACAQVKRWHDMGFHSLKVSINLSAKQLQDKNIVNIIKQVIKANNFNPSHLELELTESVVFQDEAIPVIQKFKQMGLSLAIDDFGTGYSGLTNLKMFEIDKLKIDKSFVQDIATNADSRAIAENTIALAKKLKITVIAEGVETKEQLQFFIDNGCDMIQGFYFCQPVPAEALTNLLISKKKFDF